MKRASPPDRWLDPTRGSDPTPRQARSHNHDDQHVTYHMGRAYRNESSIRDPNYTITSEEQKVLRQRQLEAAAERKAYADANLAVALRLGEALKVLKGEG